MKLLILLILIISLVVSNVNCQFDTNQVNSLNTIASNCGFTWSSPMKCGVTSTTNLNILVNCDSNNNINEIRFESQSKICDLSDDFYNYFPNLSKLIVSNLNVNKLSKTIYQHPKIETFTSATTTGSFTITSENNSWEQMVSLKYLKLNNVIGIIPTFPSTLIEFTIEAKSDGDITSRVPIEVFTQSLKLFSISFYKTPAVAPKITLQDYDFFSKSPNLQTFFFFFLSYPAEFRVFYHPPSSLSTMQIYGLNLDNTTMPSINEVSWNSLNILVLNSLKLSGTLSKEIYYLNKLTIFYANQNPSLTGQIPVEFSQRSILSQLYLQGTAIDGSLPNDMFDTQLKILDITGTLINGVAPDIFLCLPSTVFSGDDVNYKIKIDNNKFSNFPTVLTRSPCVPKITSITTPIDSTTYSLQIQGSMLGSFTPFTLVTMKNDIYQTDLYCQASIPGRLISCNNPGIFGNGTLTVYAKNLANPLPSSTFLFKYSEPVISSVTPLRTIGGSITVFGSNLWINSNQASYTNLNYIKLIKNDGSSVNCDSIVIISAFSTLKCNLPAGIEGGYLEISVSGQKNIESYAFNYQGPIINSFSTEHNNLIPTNKEISITIKGSNFWNDNKLVQVKIDSTIDCTVTSVIDSEIVCLIPAIPFKSPEGSLDLSIFINGQGATKREYLQMVDPNICPNNCGTSKCDSVIGMCMCSGSTFGPACSLNTTLSSSDISIVNSRPTLTITPSQASNETTFSVSLISIVEDSNEIQLDNWSSKQLDSNTLEYIYSGDKGQTITVMIRRNLETNKDDFISYPSNSYTYGVKYQNKDNQVDLPKFIFQLAPYPYECTAFPFNYAYPSSSTSDLRFLSLNTYNVQYSGRFPIKAYYNNNNTISTITTSVVSNSGNYSRIVTQVNQYSVEFTQFEFDFTTFTNTVPREPLITGCILPTRPPQITENDNRGIKIGVGVGVSIGGCLLAGAITLIIRQRMKLNKTQSLLESKLKEINRGL